MSRASFVLERLPAGGPCLLIILFILILLYYLSLAMQSVDSSAVLEFLPTIPFSLRLPPLPPQGLIPPSIYSTFNICGILIFSFLSYPCSPTWLARILSLSPVSVFPFPMAGAFGMSEIFLRSNIDPAHLQLFEKLDKSVSSRFVKLHLHDIIALADATDFVNLLLDNDLLALSAVLWFGFLRARNLPLRMLWPS